MIYTHTIIQGNILFDFRGFLWFFFLLSEKYDSKHLPKPPISLSLIHLTTEGQVCPFHIHHIVTTNLHST